MNVKLSRFLLAAVAAITLFAGVVPANAQQHHRRHHRHHHHHLDRH